MNQNAIMARSRTAAAVPAAPARAPEEYQVPPVDIFETKDAIQVIADLPGVGMDDITVHLDKGILSFHGKVASRVPQNMLHAEFELTDFYREFQLDESIDASRISAELKNGVLTIILPKMEEAQARVIPIQVK